MSQEVFGQGRSRIRAMANKKRPLKSNPKSLNNKMGWVGA